jgi:ketosteroid isomerase-like protein
MSKERVDTLRAIYDALNRGDLDAACGGLPPDFEFIPPPMLPEADVTPGPQGLRELWERYASIFENYRAEVEETIDAGDTVIVMAAVAGTSASGPDLKTPSFAWVWSFEDETPVRMEAMPNRATALEAVGLSD